MYVCMYVVTYVCMYVRMYVCMCKGTNDERSHTTCDGGKVISNTYSECAFVPIFIRHASACAVLHCHQWPPCVNYIFPHYSYLTNGTILGEKND